MKVKPVHDRVLIKRVAETEMSRGGIVIPDAAKEKPQEGQVIAVGPGKRAEDGDRIPMEVRKGDRVLFARYAGSEITLDGVEHVILREDEVLGIIG